MLKSRRRTKDARELVHKWHVTIPELTGKKPRKAYIYLPEDYKENTEKRYPVLYMFDGHNIFLDSDAAYGKSWGMARYLRSARKSLIVVAIECNHVGSERLEEYSPFDHVTKELGDIKGKGRLYMEWMVNELKPMIDAKLRTMPERENTLIGGSSMGALMALYGVSAYNHVFQRAACLSTSLWVNPGKAVEMILKSDIQNDTCIYMDFGSQEIYNHEATAETMMTMAHLLLSKHVDLTFRIIPGGTHSEESWGKQIPVFMECLGIK